MSDRKRTVATRVLGSYALIMIAFALAARVAIAVVAMPVAPASIVVAVVAMPVAWASIVVAVMAVPVAPVAAVVVAGVVVAGGSLITGLRRRVWPERRQVVDDGGAVGGASIPGENGPQRHRQKNDANPHESSPNFARSRP